MADLITKRWIRSHNTCGPKGRAGTKVTIVRDAEGHALAAPLLPERDEPGLGDLPDDGGQVLLLAAAVAGRGSLGVSGVCPVRAVDHRFALKWGNGLVNGSAMLLQLRSPKKPYRSYVFILFGESIQGGQRVCFHSVNKGEDVCELTCTSVMPTNNRNHVFFVLYGI